MPQQIHHRRCDGDFIFFPAAVRWLRIRTQRGDPNSPSTHSTARAPPADPGSVSPSKEQHPEALALGPGADWVTAELGSTTRSIGHPRFVRADPWLEKGARTPPPIPCLSPTAANSSPSAADSSSSIRGPALLERGCRCTSSSLLKPVLRPNFVWQCVGRQRS